MIKRSSSRNNRSKGVKVKHVLQIMLLVGICLWLIYQVKRSHDKKKEFDESDKKVSVGAQNAYRITELGRKDLLPGKNEVNQNEKHEEEEEDENIVEDEDKHEQNEHEERNGHEIKVKEDDESRTREGEGEGGEKEEDETGEEDDESRMKQNEHEEGDGHETKVKEDEESRTREGGEKEDGERGGEDDEMDENDPEKPEVVDRSEEFVDEGKEKEEEGDEKENENSKDEGNQGLVESNNIHEAREEQYKGDDASSAVTHDTRTTSTETETVSMENSDVNAEMGITKPENKPNYTEDGIRSQPGSNFSITEVKLVVGAYSNSSSSNETGNNSLSNPVAGSHQNNTALIYSVRHSEETSSNLTIVVPAAKNNMSGTDTSSEHNKMVMFSGIDKNDTVNSTVAGDVKNVQTEGLEQGGIIVSKENLSGSNLAVPVKTENRAAAGDESSNLEGGDIEKTRRFVASNENESKVDTVMSETNKTQNLSYVDENTNAAKYEESKGHTQASDASNSSSMNGTSDSIKHQATDSYNSHILKDMTEVQTDLNTMPDIRNVGDNDGDKTATD
ncbi:hypothetical protein MtrunA17_Chr5g0393951 [Medicago truncatula]|uniref:Transmembrane protein, putative n=1 Tax=Medicago truncatula TaxID=3880 RepID=G7K0Z8_MEDTR|nr:myb-like protein X [Medicago truncatula]XP_024639000.1 myb-like protein X [Medicago truncatula]AES93606.1 transmembrane protein, putative [Medicago truncatula]RHN53257.1 hypothetical protein MtrunA17_Chr5g0393951 [Medicago truncatula]